jgi:hypothetical protein
VIGVEQGEKSGLDQRESSRIKGIFPAEAQGQREIRGMAVIVLVFKKPQRPCASAGEKRTRLIKENRAMYLPWGLKIIGKAIPHMRSG